MVASKSDKKAVLYDTALVIVETSIAIADLEIPGANNVMVLHIGKWFQFDVHKL